MRYFFLCTIFIAVAFSSCELTVKNEKRNKEKSISKIRNGIVIKPTEIKVEQAFLLFEDGTLVPENNSVKINQKIILRLITSGWMEKDGKVFLSGRETVETSEGDILLDDKDLFKEYKDGLSSEEAQYISISVVITEINKLYDYFRISFQLKDENKPRNAVEGYYKLYLE